MELILDQLPEMLEMILGHLDMMFGKEAALVCRTFYEHICRAQRNRSQRLDITSQITEISWK